MEAVAAAGGPWHTLCVQFTQADRARVTLESQLQPGGASRPCTGVTGAFDSGPQPGRDPRAAQGLLDRKEPHPGR
eukprot:1896100-Alexandrium_andersonii.AAC.1